MYDILNHLSSTYYIYRIWKGNWHAYIIAVCRKHDIQYRDHAILEKIKYFLVYHYNIKFKNILAN